MRRQGHKLARPRRRIGRTGLVGLFAFAILAALLLYVLWGGSAADRPVAVPGTVTGVAEPDAADY